MFMGFIMHFYITFGTDLLTQIPAQICCFIPILVFRGNGISAGVKTERNQLEKLFLEGNPPDGLGPHVRRYGRCSRGWGRALPPGRAPLPRGAPVAPPTFSLHPYIPTYPKTSRIENRSRVPPPQASVATKNQSGPCSGTLPEGGCWCQNRRILGRGSRTVRLRRMVTGGREHDVYLGSGLLDGGKTLRPA